MYYIYRHVRPDKNEVFYIGKGKEGNGRHLSKQGRNRYWKNIVDKNEGNYDIHILVRGLSHEEALAKEQEFIKLYGRFCDGGTLCNMSLGGGSGMYGYKHSESTKLKMSRSSKGKKKSEEHRRNMSKARKGVPVSEEVREKLIKSLKKVAHTTQLSTREKAWAASRKKVRCKLTGEVYESLKEAAQMKGLLYSTLKNRMSRGSKINTLEYI